MNCVVYELLGGEFIRYDDGEWYGNTPWREFYDDIEPEPDRLAELEKAWREKWAKSEPKT